MMTKALAQRIILPVALVVAAAAAAGCSGSHSENPATGVSTAPMPGAPAPTTKERSAIYTPVTGAVAPGATTIVPASASTVVNASASGFAAEAYRVGTLEIRLAELALKKTANADVKSFALKIKHTQTAANEKLQKIVGSSEELPNNLGAAQLQQVNALEAKSGKAFNKAYADQVVTDHEQAIALFENAVSSAQTEQLRDYASQTLSMLKEHLKLAKKLQSRVGG